jgi:hypothetical protein
MFIFSLTSQLSIVQIQIFHFRGLYSFLLFLSVACVFPLLVSLKPLNDIHVCNNNLYVYMVVDLMPLLFLFRGDGKIHALWQTRNCISHLSFIFLKRGLL